MKELKEVLEFGIELAHAIVDSTKDGKLDFQDLIELWKPVAVMPKAIENADAIIDEIKNMSDEDWVDVVAYAKQKFDLEDQDVENFVEGALDLCAGLFRLIK